MCSFVCTHVLLIGSASKCVWSARAVQLCQSQNARLCMFVCVPQLAVSDEFFYRGELMSGVLSHQPAKNYLASDYFGGTSHTHLKPPRLRSLMWFSLKLELPEIPQVLVCEAFLLRRGSWLRHGLSAGPCGNGAPKVITKREISSETWFPWK